MQVIGRAANAMAEWSNIGAPPRIRPVHDRVDRRHSDLAFHVDTGGRGYFRVVIARDRSLFSPGQAGLRNASNFYDSAREGLLPFDGPPCFYLLPRSVLHAMLPAPRLYYTLIAYDDGGAQGSVHAHEPESLALEAPSVAIAAEFASGTLGLMFGTPVHKLMRVGASLGSSLGSAELDDEVGEDLEADTPQAIGLLADDGADDGDAYDRIGEAAALDAEDGSGADEDEVTYAAAQAYDGYAEDDADGDYAAPAWAAGADDTLRTPTMEDAQAAAFSDSGGDTGDDGWVDTTDSATGAQSLADDYDDGYDLPPLATPSGWHAQAVEEPGSYGYGAEHEFDGAQSFDAPLGEPLPAMLPDEDADGSASAQADEDDDGVEIEAPPVQAQAFDAAPPAPTQAFDIDACKTILARIMPFESGGEGFARLGADGEFAGRYGTAHPAYRRYHLGLTCGAFPFVQEHGTLGQLLELMRDRDRAAFERVFGGNAAALIAVTTNAEGPRAWESADGLSPRLRPVGGALLWEEPWLARFREAAAYPPFQGAQNELAARLYVQPVLPVAARLGLDTERALTLLVDRAVQMGPDAGLAWVLAAVSPLQSPAQRQQALARLGHRDLRAFQAAERLPAGGTWDTMTQAALIGALHARPDSPVPIPTREQMVAALLRHAEGTPWGPRMQKLHAAVPVDRLFQL